MASKTPLHTVLEKIQSGKISDKETGRFFRVTPNPLKPFDFNIGINTDFVDVTNAPSADALAAPMMRDAGIALDFQKIAPPAHKPKLKRKLPLIAEGDSWFKLPNVDPVVPHTLVDFLQAQLATVNLAHWGDTLDEMILKGQFWSFLQSGASDVFMFSAGGNDILGGGQLWRFLELFDVDHAKPSDAPYYLKQEFHENLDMVISNYEGLISQIKIRAPHVIMVGHGYDYAIPLPDGPWLGGPMIRQGLDPLDRPELCEAIVRVMIDSFNNRLSALQKAHPKNFKYVDLRGTVTKKNWWDELHPREAAAKKTAAKYASAIEALPASGEVLASPFMAHLDRLRVA